MPAPAPGQGPHQEPPTKIQKLSTATPALLLTPTDVQIPPKLYEKVPNLELYKKLQAAEKKLDLLVAQKGLDFQAVQAASMQPSSIKRDLGKLRVFIYNTCENMPWQKQLAGNLSDASEASWTLRVEGRFIADSGTATEAEQQKFSSFLSAASIEIFPNSEYPALQNSPNNVIEWRDESRGGPSGNFANGSPQWQFDGIDIKRSGVFGISTKIALVVKDYSSRLVLLVPMAQFTGRREASQQELVYLIWQYVLFKDLFKRNDNFATVAAVLASGVALQSMGSQADENDRLTVQCDDTLKELLKVDQFKFRDLYKLIQPHLRPRQPLVINYEVDTTKSTTLGGCVVDIPVELPVSMGKVQKEIMEENKAAFEAMASADENILYLNQRIALGIATLQTVNTRERFYRELSEDPVNFLKEWLKSQSETLRALKSEEGYNEETVRRAQYFVDNEDFLKQKIDLMLGAQKM